MIELRGSAPGLLVAIAALASISFATGALGATIEELNLTSNEKSVVQYVATTVLPMMAGSDEMRVEDAAAATWWSLNEGIAREKNPYLFSNCYPGELDLGPLEECPRAADGKLIWQVGLPGIQVGDYADSVVSGMASKLFPDRSEAQLIEESVQLAGLKPGDPVYNAILSSTGLLRRSWLLRHPTIGMSLIAAPVRDQCFVVTPKPWCAKPTAVTYEQLKAVFASVAAAPTGRADTSSHSQCRDHRDLDAFEYSGGEAAQLVVPGESCAGFKVGSDGTVAYGGQMLGKIDASVAGDPDVAVLLSAPTPQKGLRYAVLWSLGGRAAYIVDSGAQKVVVRDVVTHRRWQSVPGSYPLLTPVGSQIRWSPGESRAVVPATGEVQDVISGINVEAGSVTAIYVRGFERDVCDIQIIDVRDSRWLSETRFQFKVRLEPNPWAEEMEGYRPGMCSRGREYPAYAVTVDLNAMKVVSATRSADP